ncbi:MAG: hypothetical protein J4432_01915 [DPANN group archaeon]|nr:hypothetical protein [DPANN group archaeon]
MWQDIEQIQGTQAGPSNAANEITELPMCTRDIIRLGLEIREAQRRGDVTAEQAFQAHVHAGIAQSARSGVLEALTDAQLEVAGVFENVDTFPIDAGDE